MQRPQSAESHHSSRGSASSQLPSTPSSKTSYSYSFPRQRPPASPPQALVTIGGHTLIAPNSSLARAIVMGNESSSSSGAERQQQQHDDTANGRTDGRLAAAVAATSSLGSSCQQQRRSAPSIAAAHSPNSSSSRNYQQSRPVSNLTVLLNQHNIGGGGGAAVTELFQPLHDTAAAASSGTTTSHHPPPHNSSNNNRMRSNSSPQHDVTMDEADSASGPAPAPLPQQLGRSAPDIVARHLLLPPVQFLTARQQHSAATQLSMDKVRRCMSSKELGTLAPPSGSPYAYMLHKKEELEVSMRNRLIALREAEPDNQWRHQTVSSIDRQMTGSEDNSQQQQQQHSETDVSSSSSVRAQRECANEMRNRRRAQHAKAVVDDLCKVVADLFIAESKLLDPRNYGVPSAADSSSTANSKALEREQILQTVHSFVASLPLRYALGADTPSEVLLHMRLMAAARSDKTKAVLHIHNLADDCHWSLTVAAASARNNHSLRLVTISCHDSTGLLEYISKLLASSGSRVLDADVMLSTDGIVLDRFVVEMTGRLRLDKMVNLIEAFLREASDGDAVAVDSEGDSPASTGRNGPSTSNLADVAESSCGPLYFKPPASSRSRISQHTQEEEIKGGIPLSEVLASTSHANLSGLAFPKLRRLHSMPGAISVRSGSPEAPSVQLRMRNATEEASGSPTQLFKPESPRDTRSMRERRPLVNRRGWSDLDRVTAADSLDDLNSLDYLTVPAVDSAAGVPAESRDVPLIPFDELMLIETIGTGRVSTIYRAAWQRGHFATIVAVGSGAVQMVALKVAMVDVMTGDTSHVDELRREADIAARLEHPNICDLVGVAADPECFCLAYEYCEGGSLLSLLSDSTRYYEYLPIALDIAQGMAFLHKKCVIHRDLKPANILLTRDHRAKIADFGMSINNHGQELTAETGTYRYMAPEVIRHESYSSNADVYSFGICLWQLITREVPYATMTPIQAAYAVAEGHRPEIPASTPRRLQEIIRSCWDQDSHRRPSFTYVAMALADYAKMAFSPANVGTLTLQIANEMLATVEGNSTINVDFSTSVAPPQSIPAPPSSNYFNLDFSRNDSSSNVGLEIE